MAKAFFALIVVLLGAGDGGGGASTEGSGNNNSVASGGSGGTGSGTGSQRGSTQLSTSKTNTAFSLGSVPATIDEAYADGVCYSNGRYTVTWTPTASPSTPAQTRTYTSANWVPNAPQVAPCFQGGSIAAPNCVNPLAASPVVITPTTPVSTTAPAGTLGAETAPDNDGCYVPTHQLECLVVEKLADDSFSSTQVNLRLRNNCTSRVYADFCLQLSSGKWDCGVDGASIGGAITWPD